MSGQTHRQADCYSTNDAHTDGEQSISGAINDGGIQHRDDDEDQTQGEFEDDERPRRRLSESTLGHTWEGIEPGVATSASVAISSELPMTGRMKTDGKIASMSDVVGPPIELIALDDPYEGVISARRVGEPHFRWVNGVSDAIMTALSRGVDLVVPHDLFAQIRSDFPPDLPSYIKVC
jgi:hypothetical protein